MLPAARSVAEEKVEQALGEKKISPAAHANIMQWLTCPKYAEYRAELHSLIAAGAWTELEDRFFTVLPFGTGGRRGMVGLGANRVNRVTLGESAQGLVNYLVEENPVAKKQGIVVAHDTRLTSPDFSRFVAGIFAANGFKTLFFPFPRATPELSFAVRHLRAAAGVMVSASHNPPTDNGLKVYWHDGVQIVSPHDARVTAHGQAVETIASLDFDDCVKSKRILLLDARIDVLYHSAVLRESLSSSRSAVIAYSPLHGVGMSSVLPVLSRAGFQHISVVESQSAPDGRFPNVANHIPNPEMPESAQQVTKLAAAVSADIAITTDPDADRLGILARAASGNYVFLNGNQSAALIADYVLSRMQQQGVLSHKHFIAKTIVTTDLLDALAQEYGVRCYSNLLVGFKYLGELAEQKQGREEFVFGGEESFGILKGGYARDKDAAVAALMAAEYASVLKDSGSNLVERLDSLYKKHGVYWESLGAKVFAGAAGNRDLQRVMAKLRAHSLQELCGHRVLSVLDRLDNVLRDPVTGKILGREAGVPGDVLVFHLSSDRKTRVTIRPSGTEPKIKVYAQVFFSPLPGISDKALGAEKKRACERAEALVSGLFSRFAELVA